MNYEMIESSPLLLGTPGYHIRNGVVIAISRGRVSRYRRQHDNGDNIVSLGALVGNVLSNLEAGN